MNETEQANAQDGKGPTPSTKTDNQPADAHRARIEAICGANGWPAEMDERDAVMRQLCRLARQLEIQPEDFRRELEASHFDRKLAGNLHLVLKSSKAHQGLLRAEAPLTWEAAVEEAWGGLQAQIERIVAEHGEAESTGRRGELFRGLCALAWQWGVDPETYRRRMIIARLLPSRASEIKTVLACRAVCEAFVREKNPISWKEARDAARAVKPAGLERAARKLAGLLHRAGEGCLKAGLTDCSLKRDDAGNYVLSDPEWGELTMSPASSASTPRQPGSTGAVGDTMASEQTPIETEGTAGGDGPKEPAREDPAGSAEAEPEAMTAGIKACLGRLASGNGDIEAESREMTGIWLHHHRNLRGLRRRVKAEPLDEPLARQLDLILQAEAMRWLNPDQLTADLQKLVAELCERKNDPGTYRKLVQLGADHRHDAARYRRSLSQAGLAKEHVCELMTIIENVGVSDLFLAGKLSFLRAVESARAARPKWVPRRPRGATNRNQAAAQGLRRIGRALKVLVAAARAEAARTGQPCWPIRTGLFVLDLMPAGANGTITPW